MGPILLWCLSLWGLVTPYGDIDLGQHWPDNGLLPDSTKPPPKPLITVEGIFLPFTWEQFHRKCPWTQSVTCVQGLYFKNYYDTCIFQGPVSQYVFFTLIHVQFVHCNTRVIDLGKFSGLLHEGRSEDLNFTHTKNSVIFSRVYSTLLSLCILGQNNLPLLAQI